MNPILYLCLFINLTPYFGKSIKDIRALKTIQLVLSYKTTMTT